MKTHRRANPRILFLECSVYIQINHFNGSGGGWGGLDTFQWGKVHLGGF